MTPENNTAKHTPTHDNETRRNSQPRRILVVNPGSTSTKISVYEELSPVFETDIVHSPEELESFGGVRNQREFRLKLVIDELNRHHIPHRLDAVVGRGGLARPVHSGVYEVTDEMIHECLNAKYIHACDLGCAIARDIAMRVPPCRAFIADPGRVDELAPEARICGLPEIERVCLWHALNQKAVGRRYASEHGSRYEDLNLIICHLGGGISIAAHNHGRAIDTNNALDGEGPFSPERSGSLPVSDLVRMCYSGKYTEKQMLNKISGEGGLKALLGTNDMREVERRITDGDDKARLVANAMIWNIAKWIAAEAAVLCGKVDAVILTGGMAYSQYVVDGLKRRVSFIAPVAVYPGQSEMLALAQNALAALDNPEIIQDWQTTK